MNKLRQLFDLISDEDLQLGLEEIFEAENTGIYPEKGIIRKYCFKYKEITRNTNPVDLTSVSIGFMRQGSIRWYRDQKTNKR